MPVVTVDKSSNALSDFKVLPHWWVVQQTFGWLMRQRQLMRDYEITEA